VEATILTKLSPVHSARFFTAPPNTINAPTASQGAQAYADDVFTERGSQRQPTTHEGSLDSSPTRGAVWGPSHLPRQSLPGFRVNSMELAHRVDLEAVPLSPKVLRQVQRVFATVFLLATAVAGIGCRGASGRSPASDPVQPQRACLSERATCSTALHDSDTSAANEEPCCSGLRCVIYTVYDYPRCLRPLPSGSYCEDDQHCASGTCLVHEGPVGTTRGCR
jgi:hypothetical protein